MAISITNEKLDIFEEPLFDRSIVSEHEYTYKPYGSPSFRNSDEVRIPIHCQDLMLDIANSYIYIEGTFTPSDPTKSCYLSNNALAFLFDEIQYLMGGQQIILVRKPGITTTLKTMVSFGDTQKRNLLPCGWGLTATKQDIFDAATKTFSGRLPLKYLMGFAEDYPKGILYKKQELMLIIARTFKNCYIGETDANIDIKKIEWKIKHIVPADEQKIMLYGKIGKPRSKEEVEVAYRQWDLYELASLRETPSDSWPIKTSISLERPRYIIIGFQNNSQSDNRAEDATKFIHADISNIRLFLNSQVYPYERWNLDFRKKLYSPAYYAYENFQRSYYGRDMSEPMMGLGEFLNNPLFVIDCSRQAHGLQSSSVDINLEFETHKTKFPQNTKVYALIIHDAYLKYSIVNDSIDTNAYPLLK